MKSNFQYSFVVVALLMIKSVYAVDSAGMAKALTTEEMRAPR